MSLVPDLTLLGDSKRSQSADRTLRALYLSLWVNDVRSSVTSTLLAKFVWASLSNDVRGCVHRSLQPCKCFVWASFVKPSNTLQVLYPYLWVHDGVCASISHLNPASSSSGPRCQTHIICSSSLQSTRVHSSVAAPHQRLELILPILFF